MRHLGVSYKSTYQNRTYLRLAFMTLFVLSLGLAQPAPVITGAGYSAPAPFQVAPGQVVTLFLRDLPAAPDGSLRSSEAVGTPLPTALAGISLTVTQGQA